MEQKVYTDKDGKEYAIDAEGNHIPPMQLRTPKETSSGWDIYDTSQGHCAFCGRLSCRGYCMQGG